MNMEKYEELKIDLIEFDMEDIVTASPYDNQGEDASITPNYP